MTVYLVYHNATIAVVEVFATPEAAEKFVGNNPSAFTITPWEVVG